MTLRNHIQGAVQRSGGIIVLTAHTADERQREEDRSRSSAQRQPLSERELATRARAGLTLYAREVVPPNNRRGGSAVARDAALWQAAGVGEPGSACAWRAGVGWARGGQGRTWSQREPRWLDSHQIVYFTLYFTFYGRVRMVDTARQTVGKVFTF